MRTLRGVGALVVIGGLLAAGCGGGASASNGPVEINWYTAPQPGGSFAEAAKACSAASNGKYTITVQPLPSDATAQREQLVRRLAAHDSTIDLISMDVIWTAEFGEAGWVDPWPKSRADQIGQGVIPAVLKTGQYKNRMYAAPLDTASQLLWYRKDLVKTPPKTWAEMIQMADQLPKNKNWIEVQAARYEGYTVWFNTLLESAGGSILTKTGKVALPTGPTEAALKVIKDVATSKAADPSMSNNQEDQGRLAFEAGNAAFMVNYPYVYASLKADKPKLFPNLGIALYPRVDANKPAKVTLGGFNIGVGAYGKHKSVAFDAGTCLGQPEQQVLYAVKDGLPPVSQALYKDPRIVKAYPYADLLLQTFSDGSTRPVSPAYNDISLAVQRTIHPPSSINPTSDVGALRSKVDDAIHSRGLL
ncbi:MAG: lpqY [Actinomycetia bacterium]|nr:lpqY [Actinomycetes bacterium]